MILEIPISITELLGADYNTQIFHDFFPTPKRVLKSYTLTAYLIYDFSQKDQSITLYHINLNQIMQFYDDLYSHLKPAIVIANSEDNNNDKNNSESPLDLNPTFVSEDILGCYPICCGAIEKLIKECGASIIYDKGLAANTINDGSKDIILSIIENLSTNEEIEYKLAQNTAELNKISIIKQEIPQKFWEILLRPLEQRLEFISKLTPEQQTQFTLQKFYDQHLRAKQSDIYLKFGKQYLNQGDRENAIGYFELVSEDYVPAKLEALQLLAKVVYQEAYETVSNWERIRQELNPEELSAKKIKLENSKTQTASQLNSNPRYFCIRGYSEANQYYCKAIELIRLNQKLANSLICVKEIAKGVHELLKTVLGVNTIKESEVSDAIIKNSSNALMTRIYLFKTRVILEPAIAKAFAPLFEQLGLNKIPVKSNGNSTQNLTSTAKSPFSFLPNPSKPNLPSSPTTSHSKNDELPLVFGP